eukprot:TRINITY_DN17169_c0_g2_i1.p1 TRINITY_DN17169_c0_g2~~TRINITY_DN17169_c0_g2_i1.p1  ORF type:complete len:591 (+),score=72.59 TRINITY_DN17169_c0_g2_i1:49-1821(+)
MNDPDDDEEFLRTAVVVCPSNGKLRAILGAVPLRFSCADDEELFQAQQLLRVERAARAIRIVVAVCALCFAIWACIVWPVAIAESIWSIKAVAPFMSIPVAALILTVMLRCKLISFVRVLALLTVIGVTEVVMSQYRFDVIFNDESLTTDFSDSFVIIKLCALLSLLTCSPIPSRFAVLLYIALPLIYSAATVPLPGHYEGTTSRRVLLSLCLSMLSASMFVSRVQLEMAERTNFLQQSLLRRRWVQEKVKRASAEHEAEQGPLSRPAIELPSQDDVTSAIGSVDVTSIIFAGDLLPLPVHFEALYKLACEEGWLISGNHFDSDFQEKLGQGGYGSVFKGRYLQASVAVKVATGEDPLKRFQAVACDIRSLRNVVHPNIVTFFGACVSVAAMQILVIEELVEGKSLHQRVEHAGSFDYDNQLTTLIQICSALAYLHSRNPGIAHGDIKPRNIMVSDSWKVKLIDFGLSRFDTASPKKVGGTARWAAPEVYGESRHEFPLAADIFSFGRVVYFVALAEKPLKEYTDTELREFAKRGKLPELQWPQESALRTISERCSSLKMEQRPAAEDLLLSLSELACVDGQSPGPLIEL